MALIDFNYPFGMTQSAFEVFYLVIEIIIGSLGILFNSILLYVIFKVSFIFRYWVLVKNMPTSKTIIIICVLVYMPSVIFMTPYVINYTPSEVIREKIRLYHPEYDLTRAVVSGNGYVFDWPTVVGIIYMCIPSPFIYGVILYFRRNTLQYLNVETCNLSFESKSGHRVLIRALTIQACIPVLYLVGITQYWLGQFKIIGGPIPEYGAFLSMALMPVITPVISLYYISPYRKAVLDWLRIGQNRAVTISPRIRTIQLSIGDEERRSQAASFA